MIFPGVKRTKILCRRKLVGKRGRDPRDPSLAKLGLKTPFGRGIINVVPTRG
jgi:hypothetical protein